jgi:molybdopterin converting factor small subunit
MKVSIPTPLRSYTGQAAIVEAEGGTIAELLVDLDRRYPGIRFRMIDEQDTIREHVRIFVNRERVVSLDASLETGDEVQILQALSGG